MTEAERERQLAHIRAAIAEADRQHTPEDLAKAAHELEQKLTPAAVRQGQLPLRTAG
jgi:hypothetical protein